jgi:NitT/TauT family transport system substrate-binding protein
MYSPDGRFVPGAVETAYQVLKVFDPSVAGATVDLAKTHTSTFVEKALAGK